MRELTGPTRQPRRGERVCLIYASSHTNTHTHKEPRTDTHTPFRIVIAAGQLVLQNQGVIRGISNWGVFTLPRATSVHQMRHHYGHYFAMRFDASPAAQQAVRSMLALDPRMIRHSSVRIGDNKLETMSRVGPGVAWKR